MKSALSHLCTFFLLGSFILSSTFVKAHNTPEEDKFSIQKRTQTLVYHLSKKGKLTAKLTVEEVIISNSFNPVTYTRRIPVDKNSKLKNVFEKEKNAFSFPVAHTLLDYESSAIFFTDMKIAIFKHEFSKKGQVVTFKYTKLYSDVKFIAPLYFDDIYDVGESVISILAPEALDLDIREINFSKSQPIASKTKAGFQYKLLNLKSRKNFKRAPQRSNYSPHLITIPRFVTPGEHTIVLMKDVSGMYKWYASLVQEIGNEPKVLESLVKKITTAKHTDIEKIEAIYFWVQDNIRYIAFEDGIMGFRPESCQSVLQNKYGDCKGMANLTKEMLKIAGYDARLTWLGTSDLPYTYDIPSLLVDNHMICTVLLRGKKYFLDATEKFGDLGNYYPRIAGQQALIEDGNTFILETIPNASFEENKETLAFIYNLEGENCKGSGVFSFYGDEKTSLLYFLANIASKDHEDFLNTRFTRGNNNVNLQLLSLPDFSKRDTVLHFEVASELKNQVIDLGDEMYINLETQFYLKGLAMEKERNIPYQFTSKSLSKITTTFQIPEEWEVNYTPETLDFNTPNYHFHLSYKVQGTQIKYQTTFKVKNLFLQPNDFEAWNKMIQSIEDFYANPIILTKK